MPEVGGGEGGDGAGGRWREDDRMITVIRSHNKVTRTLFVLLGEHNTQIYSTVQPGLGTITTANREELGLSII